MVCENSSRGSRPFPENNNIILLDRILSVVQLYVLLLLLLLL